jgi:NADH-quinone oxidoreductase subunit E
MLELAMPVLSDDIREAIKAYIPRYPRKQAVTLPALHLVHDTMTFYEFFKHDGDKLGETRLWVCRGLACMLRGAYELIDHFEAKLGVKCGQTTPDGKVTLEFAECIGACDGAPACLRDDVHVMDVTPEKADKLIEELKANGRR